MIELVHSVATAYIKAGKAGQAATKNLEFDALRHIYAYKKDIETSRQYIRDCEVRYKKPRTFSFNQLLIAQMTNQMYDQGEHECKGEV